MEPIEELRVKRLVVVDDDDLEMVVAGPLLHRPGFYGVDVRGPSLDQHAVLAAAGDYSGVWVTFDERRRIGLRAGPHGVAELFVSNGGVTVSTWYGNELHG